MLKRNILRIIIVLVLLLNFNSILVKAHSGRTDSSGGHYNRSTGEYHYHNNGYTEIAENNEKIDWRSFTIKDLSRDELESMHEENTRGLVAELEKNKQLEDRIGEIEKELEKIKSENDDYLKKIEESDITIISLGDRNDNLVFQRNVILSILIIIIIRRLAINNKDKN